MKLPPRPNARHLDEPYLPLVREESAEIAQIKVVAIRSFEHRLHCVEPRCGKSLVADGCDGYLLQAGGPTPDKQEQG
jgi:hypothetical protein